MPSRRHFLAGSAAAAGLATLPQLTAPHRRPPPRARRRRHPTWWWSRPTTSATATWARTARN
ncbi:twin-arginine translocation signal domain-containing protein [Streptomyces sp. NPDC006514]|uniref:twin-arginine translocation signal domain-containing protein n=1 Tax=Streptomyces sp. NPDC006514 TaxID=3154308 RepID=UPI0033AECAAC